MYILFDMGQDYASSYSSEIKPFTTGIKIDDISGLTKEIEKTKYINKTKNGKQLYVDKFGMPTTDSRDAEPMQEKVVAKETIDFAHYPNEFNKIDVMKYKQKFLMEENKADKVLMYEFDIYKFIDKEKSENIQLLQDDVELFQKGFLKTNPISIDGYKTFSILVDSEDKVESYYSYDGENYVKAKKSNPIVDNVKEIYIGFKNKLESDNMVYGYQILLKR